MGFFGAKLFETLGPQKKVVHSPSTTFPPLRIWWKIFGTIFKMIFPPIYSSQLMNNVDNNCRKGKGKLKIMFYFKWNINLFFSL